MSDNIYYIIYPVTLNNMWNKILASKEEKILSLKLF